MVNNIDSLKTRKLNLSNKIIILLLLLVALKPSFVITKKEVCHTLKLNLKSSFYSHEMELSILNNGVVLMDLAYSLEITISKFI
jgi:hypothetical protein